MYARLCLVLHVYIFIYTYLNKLTRQSWIKHAVVFHPISGKEHAKLYVIDNASCQPFRLIGTNHHEIVHEAQCSKER